MLESGAVGDLSPGPAPHPFQRAQASVIVTKARPARDEAQGQRRGFTVSDDSNAKGIRAGCAADVTASKQDSASFRGPSLSSAR
ncbi:hypothetical protein CMQ_1212 [Grosmannia clavigera kw1407]|uniref:Uncharacterized protein n=1 Tax=Grosmannia clavigera (strain kw1407 / UAMH 11150) TaxID=655863 RepID=F0XDE6_GROCL|nr:uncharacterized protein CMQ_1212 [Grosmannia clavigera kw1407]EFX04284.1 hypothetical protein CMQ_1212 [Grosmannia clavigera kw1407]